MTFTTLYAMTYAHSYGAFVLLKNTRLYFWKIQSHIQTRIFWNIAIGLDAEAA